MLISYVYRSEMLHTAWLRLHINKWHMLSLKIIMRLLNYGGQFNAGTSSEKSTHVQLLSPTHFKSNGIEH